MSHHWTKAPLRFLLAAALWLSAAPAFGQQYNFLPPEGVVGNTLSIPQPGSFIPFYLLASKLRLPANGGLVRGPASATQGHAVVFGESPNDIADGGGLAGTGTLTLVTCGTGLSGGSFTTNGTCAVNLTRVTNALGADVAMNNIANYFDGPSTAQGTSGTWLATGTVTLVDTSGSAQFFCKLWDGTSIIASGWTLSNAINRGVTMSLSGILASPAANIRISCRDPSGTTGLIVFNATGNSKDSTLTVLQVQ